MNHHPPPPTIRSSAAEYLTYIAATGDSGQSFEMRYEGENIWLTQKMMAKRVRGFLQSPFFVTDFVNS